jgi:hypothetical protein
MIPSTTNTTLHVDTEFVTYALLDLGTEQLRALPI